MRRLVCGGRSRAYDDQNSLACDYPPPFMTQRKKHLAGWSPVAGTLGRPDLRRDAVEPNQRGFTRTTFLSTPSLHCEGFSMISSLNRPCLGSRWGALLERRLAKG